MIECKFELNSKPISALIAGSTKFPAWSGIGKHINRRASACVPNQGPIPPGMYYIFDRHPGARKDAGRNLWFALHAVDKKIDDTLICDDKTRDLFRIHPGGPSNGCVSIKSKSDFLYLRQILIGGAPSTVPGTTMLARGLLVVT